jgi:release factor glutamine methyltransferase
VRESEKTKMHKNVLEFEPHSALFVSDNEPLLYYSAISNLAFNILNTLGKIYFEINENFGEECKLILEQNGFSNCKIHLDLNNKTRFVSGVKA